MKWCHARVVSVPSCLDRSPAASANSRACASHSGTRRSVGRARHRNDDAATAPTLSPICSKSPSAELELARRVVHPAQVEVRHARCWRGPTPLCLDARARCQRAVTASRSSSATAGSVNTRALAAVWSRSSGHGRGRRGRRPPWPGCRTRPRASGTGSAPWPGRGATDERRHPSATARSKRRSASRWRAADEQVLARPGQCFGGLGGDGTVVGEVPRGTVEVPGPLLGLATMAAARRCRSPRTLRGRVS